MSTISKPAVVKKLGVFGGGSYGFGNPSASITLWVADCQEYRAARAENVVSAIAPWVFPTRAAAARAIRAGKSPY
mgnify:CR=1 FL=1